MIDNRLQAMLSKKFNVLGFVDLADLSASPVSAFKFFNNLYKSEYAPNDRLVIYTGQTVPNKL